MLMVKGEVLSSVESAAFGAKLSAAEVIPNFPAPFSVEITKKLSKIHSCSMFEVQSSDDAFSAAIGSAAAGKRVFIPCSSPLSYSVFAAPFMRLPFVAANVSRSQHGVKPDHSTIMALRDFGYLMFFPEGNQEIHDMIIQAYRIAEDPKVLLPAVVNIDGLPSFSEPVQVATDAAVRGFLSKPRFSRLNSRLDIYSDNYEAGKLQLSKAMDNALELIPKAGEKWKQKFHRSYDLVEKFMLDDAETVIVVMGYHSTTAKAAVRKLRAGGKKIGLLRIYVFRPWPRAAVNEALANAKKVLVFEQAVSLGVGGILRAHIGKGSTLVCLGKYPSEKDFIDAVARVEKSEKELKLWL